jgi:hypothetical protein
MISTEPPTTPSDGDATPQERLTKRDDKLDAARYRFLRDVPEYDSGMAVANLPSERRDIDLVHGRALDEMVDREALYLGQRYAEYEAWAELFAKPLTQGLVGDSSPPSPDSAGSNNP